MANIKESQLETFALIDTSKAMIDKVLSIIQILELPSSASFSFATNPIGFLLQMAKELGIGYEEIRQWLTKYLIYAVPVLEVTVKAILLTNLKHMVSCSIDPRIPEKYRKRHFEDNFSENGINIDIESIDYLNKLAISPLSDEGREWYFGIDGVNDVYKFARADDFDAFLWFVIHKGKFPLSQHITSPQALSGDGVSVKGDTLLKTVKITYEPLSGAQSSILVGNTFAYTKGLMDTNIVSMCIDASYNEENKIVENTLIPISDDWNSVNWYARNAYQLGKNLGFGWGVNQETSDTRYKGKSRDFDKEKAICNISYVDQASSTAPITGLVNNKLRFTILPKPAIHVPGGDEFPTNFKKLLFNGDGEYDSNGHYTLTQEMAETLIGDNDENSDIQIKYGKIIVKNKQEVAKHLIACYKGLTVYEFNYDYVMSLKLFDAKVLVTSILDSLINLRVGININLNEKKKQRQEAIREIIKTVIESDDSELSDCFYTFDNSKYDALLRKTEENRAKRGNTSAINEVIDILNEYNENAQLNERIDTIDRAISQAASVVSETASSTDKAKIEFNFVFDLIENLVQAIMDAVLSPKVLMALEVNNQLMGGSWEKFSFADLLRAMQSIIVSIIKEVKDQIIQELLKLVLKQLLPLISVTSSMILREQMEYYIEAIQDIIRNCPTLFPFSFRSQYLNTTLDEVDYADIDANATNNGEQPKTNNC